MLTEVKLPRFGEMMEEATVTQWMKHEGERVEQGEVLLLVETEKASLEVESPASGFLRKILASEGETVPVQSVVALIAESADEDVPGQPAPVRPDAEEVSNQWREARPLTSQPKASAPKITPVAQRLAAQLGVDLAAIEGSGPRGRITRADVERIRDTQHKKRRPTPPSGSEIASEVPMRGVRARIAQRMHLAHQATAPVTLATEVEATELVETRQRLNASLGEERGPDLGYNDLLVKLVAHALREFSYMNARLEAKEAGDTTDGAILHLDEVHIGLAVDTERGLLVPVIRNPDRKSLHQIAEERQSLVERARSGKALPEELTGSTFTITNLGMHGIDLFTPIINMPEAAILGVGRVKPRPAVVEGKICVRQVMWLSLTFDHRLIDGAPAARFLQHLNELVQDLSPLSDAL